MNDEAVLNAFRHHRVLRENSVILYDAHDNPCSTPFGITGCYASKWMNREAKALECSTPFGITGCYAFSA